MNAVRPPRMTALAQLREAESGGSFAILIGTILSARTRDENTARVVKNLLARYATAEALASAQLEDVEEIIHSIGFYHVKARRVIEVASMICREFGGQVPEDMDTLLKLPGVGRKTANCVLVYAFGKPAIPVDIHVHRISNRLGIVKTKTPEETEQDLMRIIPTEHWLEINDTFVRYGQNICKPIMPSCGVCRIRGLCKYYAGMNDPDIAEGATTRPVT